MNRFTVYFFLIFSLGGFLFVAINPTLQSASDSAGARDASPERLRSDVVVLSGIFPSRNARNVSSMGEAANHIFKTFSTLGYTVQLQEISVNGRIYKNVRATNDKPGPRIVVGAHYDVFSEMPGADDNASGVAGLLELARVFSAVSLNRNIEFVAYALQEPPYFDTEVMGSYQHAQALVQEKVEVDLAIILEMIGYYTDEPESQKYPVPGMNALFSKVGNFITIIGRPTEFRHVRKIKEAFLRTAQVPVHSLNLPSFFPGVASSDQINYWKHKIPAVMITDTAHFRNPHHHTQGDLPETLDYKRMATVIDALVDAIKTY